VEDDRSVKEGCWDSIHVVEVEEHGPKRATYKLTTTIMLHMAVEKPEIGDTILSGSLTRQVIHYKIITNPQFKYLIYF
jgi:capping protein beta